MISLIFRLIIFCSILFNMVIMSLGGANIYLNVVLLFFLGIILLSYTILNVKTIFILRRSNPLLISALFFIMLIIFGLKDEPNSITSTISLILFSILIIIFTIYLNNVDEVDIYSIYFYIVLALGLKNFYLIINFNIAILDIHNRISIEELGNFNNYAYLTVLSLSMKLFLALKRKFSSLLILLIIIDIFVLIFLFSRGGWISLLLILFIYIYYQKLSFMKIRYFVVGIIGIALYLYIDSKYFIGEKIINRFTQLSTDGGTGRSAIWEYTLKEIYDMNIVHFLLGMGNGMFYEYFYGRMFDSVHNGFIEILYENGLMGLIVFVSLIIFVYRQKINMSSETRFLFTSVITIFILSNFFDSHIYIIQTNWIYALLFATLISLKKETEY